MTPEQRAKRLHHHMYETCETPAEHAERIVALEELVIAEYKLLERTYWQPAGFLTHGGIKSGDIAKVYEAIRMLGIEVS